MHDSFGPGAISCPEKIVIILDPSAEMAETYFDTNETNLKTNFKWIKVALRKFLMSKAILNRKHEFALALLQPDGNLFWYQTFTTDVKLILDCLNDTEANSDANPIDIQDICLDSVFKEFKEHLAPLHDKEQSLVPKFVLRAILFYGRSQCELTLSDSQAVKKMVEELYACKRFSFDVLYLRHPQLTDEHAGGMAKCLRKSGIKESGYTIEVSEQLSHLFEGLARLLAHPLQRSNHLSPCYTLKLDGPELNAMS